MAKNKVRNSPEKWQELIKQAVRYKEGFCGSNSWSQYREWYRGNFNGELDTLEAGDELEYNITYAMARTMIPNVYFRNPYVNVTPRFKPGAPDMTHQAKLVEAVDNWILQEIDFKSTMKTAILDSFFCGRGVLKVGYDSEFGYATEEAMAELGVNDATASQYAKGDFEKQKIEHNANIKPGMPFVQRVDPDHFLVPFGQRNLKECDWVDHIVVRQLQDAKLDPKYTNMKDIEGTHLERALANSNKRRVFQELSKHIDWIEIHEIRDARFRELSCVVDDKGGAYIRGPIEDELQMDGLPFVSFAFNEDPEYFWAPSDCKLMASQQREMNESRTQTMMHRRIDLLKFLYKEGTLDESELDKLMSGVVGPAVSVKGDPANSIVPLQPRLPQELVQWPEIIRSDVREMFGIGRNQAGQQSGGRRTAKEASIIQQAHELRMDERRDIMADSVTEVLRKVNQVIFSFWDTPRVVQVVGYDGARYWVEYTKDAIKGEYDLKVDVESLTPQTKQMKRQEIMQLMQSLGNNPMALDYLMKQMAHQFDWLDATQMFPQAQPIPGQQPGGGPMQAEQFNNFQGQLMENPQLRQSRVRQNAQAMGG